ncbi:MAG: HGGxSTG domain-containing protein [Acidobacteriota bacterium]
MTDRGKKLCGAKARSGEPCKNIAMPNGRCRFHGGMSLAGPACPAFKTGRHSKYLPAKLLDRYHAAVADETLLELRHEVALLDVRIGEILAKIETGESSQVWTGLRDALRTFMDALSRRDAVRMREPLQRMQDLVSKGAAEYSAWDDVVELLEQRRKLVESERKRLVEMQQMMTNEQAMVLLAVVVDTIRKHVTDRQALAAISADITRLVAAQPRG